MTLTFLPNQEHKLQTSWIETALGVFQNDVSVNSPTITELKIEAFSGDECPSSWPAGRAMTACSQSGRIPERWIQESSSSSTSCTKPSGVCFSPEQNGHFTHKVGPADPSKCHLTDLSFQTLSEVKESFASYINKGSLEIHFRKWT